MRAIHYWLSWIVIVANAAVGVVGTAAQWATRLRSDRYWYAAHATWFLTVAEVTIGVLALQSGAAEQNGFHYFYGFLCMAAVAIVYTYRPQLTGWEWLLYGLGSLFIMGLAMRAALL